MAHCIRRQLSGPRAKGGEKAVREGVTDAGPTRVGPASCALGDLETHPQSNRKRHGPPARVVVRGLEPCTFQSIDRRQSGDVPEAELALHIHSIRESVERTAIEAERERAGTIVEVGGI